MSEGIHSCYFGRALWFFILYKSTHSKKWNKLKFPIIDKTNLIVF